MILVLMGVASIFTEFGLGAALVQKKDLRDEHSSSIFWLNVALGLTAYLVFWGLRNVIAGFYDRPVLSQMIPILASTLVIASITSVQTSLLRKRLKFSSIAISAIIADLVGSTVAIATAYYGQGPWALIWKAVTHRSIFCIGMWMSSNWRPAFAFSIDAIREIFSFSSNYLSTTLFSYVAVKMDELMIGKYVGDVGLGLYSNAFKIILAPVALIKNQIVGVFFPAFSGIQKEKERVKKISLQLSGILALVGFPTLLFIAISAHQWIQVLLDPKWIGMNSMAVLLSFVALFEISIFPGAIFLSQGRADAYFRLMLWTKSLSSIGIIIGVFTSGTIGLITGMLIAAILNFVPYLYFSGRLIDMTVKEQLSVNAGPFLIAVGIATTVHVTSYFFLGDMMPLALLAVKTVAFVAGVFGCYWLFKPYPIDFFSNVYFQRTSKIA